MYKKQVPQEKEQKNAKRKENRIKFRERERGKTKIEIPRGFQAKPNKSGNTLEQNSYHFCEKSSKKRAEGRTIRTVKDHTQYLFHKLIVCTFYRASFGRPARK